MKTTFYTAIFLSIAPFIAAAPTTEIIGKRSGDVLNCNALDTKILDNPHIIDGVDFHGLLSGPFCKAYGQYYCQNGQLHSRYDPFNFLIYGLDLADLLTGGLCTNADFCHCE